MGRIAYPALRDRLFHSPGIWSMRCCVAPDCGAYWLDPSPAPSDLHKLYAGYYTHFDAKPQDNASILRSTLKRLRNWIYDSYYHVKYGYGQGRPSLVSRVVYQVARLNPHWCAHMDFHVFYLPAEKRGNLLEIGCGGGRMLQAMQSKGWQVSGLDFDQDAVSNAQEKGLNVHHGDLLSLDLPASSFDAVVMSHVIEHLPDPLAVLQRSFELLKPGGQLVIITPNIAGGLHRAFRQDWRGLEPPRHLTIFSGGSLDRLVRRAGFGNVNVTTTIRDSGYLRLASQSLRRKSHYGMSKKFSLTDRISGEFFGLLLGYRHLLDPSKGDELVAICRKD